MGRNFRYIIPFTVVLLISGCTQEKPQPGINNAAETSLPAVSKKPEKTEISGTYENVNWTLSKDCVLTIGGTGKIKDGLCHYIEQQIYDSDESIGTYLDDVKRIIITDGITELSDAFEYCEGLKSVEMADSVQKIGKFTFDQCYQLEEIRLSPNITRIGEDAFAYCRSLKKIVLPEKLEKYNKNAIRGCTALEEVENRSAKKWKLPTEDMAGCWFCDGKEVDELPPGKTAVIHSVKYPITYDLRGGVATGKLPASYNTREGCKIPKNVKREGWSLASWHITYGGAPFGSGFLTNTIRPEEEGSMKITPLWIKFRLNRMKNGKIRAEMELDLDPHMEYNCLVRFSREKNMSVSEYYVMGYSDEDFKRCVVLDEMKKGKRYYVEYAITDEDLDNDEDVSWDYPWQGKQEIICG